MHLCKMDDFDISSLQESKNEWAARLVNVLTPLINEGLHSIFDEAWNLCEENDEEDKYLMTFQNFLSRIPKWNPTIIDEETKRIVTSSGCSYLTDLITCVHVIQLKVLTCVRVGQKQKKINIDIPKLNDFIHKIYINVARKVYTNAYLFEKYVAPLAQQKNNRELEIIIKESVLNAIRDSIPIENILRAYMDETFEDDIIEQTEEVVTKPIEEETETSETANKPTENETTENITVSKSEEKNTAEKVETETSDNTTDQATKNPEPEEVKKKKEENYTKPTIPDLENESTTTPIVPPQPSVAPRTETSEVENVKLSFDNMDTTIDPHDNIAKVEASKSIDRLEQISEMRSQQRKEEEALEKSLDDDEDVDVENEKIQIHDDNLKLGDVDVQVLNNDILLKKDPILTDVEVLH